MLMLITIRKKKREMSMEMFLWVKFYGELRGELELKPNKNC